MEEELCEDYHKSDIGYMIKVLNDALERNANEDLRPTGVTLSQLRVVSFIMMQPNQETTQKAIEDYLNVSHPTVNGILKRLEEKGLIASELSVNRRLTKLVRITEVGKEHCQRAEERRVDSEAMLSKYLTEEEHATLMVLLQKVYKGVTEKIA